MQNSPAKAISKKKSNKTKSSSKNISSKRNSNKEPAPSPSNSTSKTFQTLIVSLKSSPKRSSYPNAKIKNSFPFLPTKTLKNGSAPSWKVPKSAPLKATNRSELNQTDNCPKFTFRTSCQGATCSRTYTCF